MRDYVNFFSWYDDFLQRAWRTANQQHQELGEIYRRIGMAKSRDALLELSSQGIELAKKLDQPYWEIYFRYVQARMYNDAKDRLQKYIELYVDSNKPRYRECPFNPRIYVGLLMEYTETDPAGYATEIVEGADYVEFQLSIDQISHLSLADMRVQAWRAKRDWRQALHAAQRLYELTEELIDDRARIQAACYLTEIYYQIGSYHLVMDTSRDIEPLARKLGQMERLIMLMHWRASAAARMERLDESRNIMREVTKFEVNMTFTAEMLFSRINHAEHLEEYSISFRECLSISEYLKKNGEYHWEYEFRLRACVFLKKMTPIARWMLFGGMKVPFKEWRRPQSTYLLWPRRIYYLLAYTIFIIVGIGISLITRPTRKAFTNAHQAAQQLKNPQPYLDRLTRLELGDYSQI